MSVEGSVLILREPRIRTPPLFVPRVSSLRVYLYVAGFDRYLREIVGTDKLARARLDHVVEEDLADRVVVVAGFAVVENGEEGSIKLIVENRIARFTDRAAARH